MGPIFGRVAELQQHVGVVDDRRGGLRELRAVVSFERGDRRPRLVGVLGVVDFLHRRLAPGCADFGSTARTFACAWNQQRCSFVYGKTSRSAFQKRSAPSPTARNGARMPRRRQSRSRLHRDATTQSRLNINGGSVDTLDPGGSSRPARSYPSGNTPSYTGLMSKVMVSLPDGLLAELDAEVKRRGTSRSALLADAARRELARRDPADLAAAIERSERRFRGAGSFESADVVRVDRDDRP